jgi:glycosyltransferase involved in cell wall biosynthesis
MIDFSIVIPVYNGAKSIEKLIENIEKEGQRTTLLKCVKNCRESKRI